MRLTALAPIVVVLACVIAARSLGAEARSQRATWPESNDEPYSPTAEAAPYVTLGYREVATDLLWIRALAYVGGDHATSPGVRHIVEAMVALDPRFEEAYNWGSLAMQSVSMKMTNADYYAVLAIMERGMKEFPENWKLPLRAGEIYARGLKTDAWPHAAWFWGGWWEQVWKYAWKAEGAMLLSRAVRLPGAHKAIGTYVAHLETELGQRDKAIRDLRELITYTSNPHDRDRLVKKLAKLTNASSDSLAYELDVERTQFEAAWKRDRPELTPTMYVVLGPPLRDAFDLADLAADPDAPVEAITPLPPLPDDANGEAPAPN